MRLVLERCRKPLPITFPLLFLFPVSGPWICSAPACCPRSGSVWSRACLLAPRAVNVVFLRRCLAARLPLLDQPILHFCTIPSRSSPEVSESFMGCTPPKFTSYYAALTTRLVRSWLSASFVLCGLVLPTQLSCMSWFRRRCLSVHF